MPITAANFAFIYLLQLIMGMSQRELRWRSSDFALRLQAGGVLCFAAVLQLFHGPHAAVGLRDRYDPALHLAHGSTVAYVAIHLAVALTIVPWLDSVLFLRRFGGRLISSAQLAKLLAAIVAIACVAALIVTFNHLINRFLKHPNYILIPFLISAGIPVLIILLSNLVAAWRDRGHLQRSKQATAASRTSIAADFSRFQTTWYRRKYVLWLRESQMQPLGPWPNGRPNAGDDASTLLAQLDERWLGLES
jgi:hypothetical protein